jgi:hypothetical protein
MPSQLRLDVFVVPYKPIAGPIPPTGEGEATWPATSVSLPTKHRIFPRAPDGRSLPEPLVVSIDLSEIAFA